MFLLHQYVLPSLSMYNNLRADSREGAYLVMGQETGAQCCQDSLGLSVCLGLLLEFPDPCKIVTLLALFLLVYKK